MRFEPLKRPRSGDISLRILILKKPQNTHTSCVHFDIIARVY